MTSRPKQHDAVMDRVLDTARREFPGIGFARLDGQWQATVNAEVFNAGSVAALCAKLRRELPKLAMEQLCRALAERDIPTRDSDVMTTAGGHYMLSLAPGLLVWSVPKMFRWFSAGRMVLHSSADPAGTADLLVELFDRQPWLRYRREYLEALMEPAEASPI
ncbi:hypothetical protein OIE13_31545 [Streptosporangium sp. NBC_01810]|uniref:hypothetical protein n=1 Tax=Streptosporangium sp. NBC_01810 TaxID=2975951 RepID=UPI002DDB352C|nr:hypothetical protein [Streptosporangium sp. NBC_01810]WSA25406.1 hypothetical protein OIE13_31545 [Streptosporangium sp. NBC_01810]